MDDLHGLMGRNEDEFPEAAVPSGADEEDTLLAVVGLFGVADEVGDGVEDVRIIDVVLASAPRDLDASS